jgi:poly-gamma-glutamate synthesis protein (capsule biosynthesis protein)
MRACLVLLLGWSAGCGDAIEATPPVLASAERLDSTPTAPAPAIATESPELLIEASGDLVLNSLAMGFVREHPSDEAGYRALLEGYARSLRPDALTYLNLEMPLVDDHVDLDGGWPRSRTERPRRAPVLGASVALAALLASIGVELVGVANNHALDQGHQGLRETLDALDAAHLMHAGVGSDRDAAHAARITLHRGHRVAFLSATDAINRRSEDGPPLSIARLDPEAPLVAAIESARSEAALVIVALHWSTDFVAETSASQRRLARRLIDAGADVILGTGPHVLQAVEHLRSARGDALVAYSLGNLASGMGRAYRLGVEPEHFIHPANVRAEARDGVVLRLRVRFDPITIETEAVLLFTENDWLTHREHPTLRVQTLADVALEVCEDRLPSMRAALGAIVPTIPDRCLHEPTGE